mmetsp:Transcript_27993/g.80243  ORF Transcript_27993/g.80243 Transcript_27993/m.80243 type:complete len:202 (+) Transcript_27993:137-742(+)
MRWSARHYRLGVDAFDGVGALGSVNSTSGALCTLRRRFRAALPPRFPRPRSGGACEAPGGGGGGCGIRGRRLGGRGSGGEGDGCHCDEELPLWRLAAFGDASAHLGWGHHGPSNCQTVRRAVGRPKSCREGFARRLSFVAGRGCSFAWPEVVRGWRLENLAGRSGYKFLHARLAARGRCYPLPDCRPLQPLVRAELRRQLA